MTPADKKQLKARAHNLKPVVSVGQSGLSETVLAEIELALDHHELIKIKIRSSDRETRKQTGQAICAATGAELLQRIGQIIVIYRKNPDR